MTKRIVALGLFLTVVAAGPAAAQQYPPAENSLVISDTRPTPGQTISITARTFSPGCPVTVVLDPGGVPLGSGPADAEGVLTLDVTVPEDTELGAHTIVVSCAGLELTGRIVVVAAQAAAAPAGPPEGALPETGGDSLPLAQAGVVLLAIGGLVTAVATKRRKAAGAF